MPPTKHGADGDASGEPAKKKLKLPQTLDTADPEQHPFISLDSTVAELEKLLRDKRVVFVRGGVAIGKSTLSWQLQRMKPATYLRLAGGDTQESWETALLAITEASTVEEAAKVVYDSNRVLVVDEAHEVFPHEAFLQKLLKPTNLPGAVQMVLLSAAAEGQDLMTMRLHRTPPDITNKCMWVPPAPEAAALAGQLELAGVLLSKDAVEFFLRFCGFHRGIFMRAMQWVFEQQAGCPLVWDISKAHGHVSLAFHKGRWDVPGGFLAWLAGSRAVKANGGYDGTARIPEEFARILCEGPTADLPVDLRRELTVAGLLLPMRSDQPDDSEFFALDWGVEGTKYGVANPMVAAYYWALLPKKRNLKVLYKTDLTDCIDLCLRAVPFLTFALLVGLPPVRGTEISSPLSAEGLPREPRYSGAVVETLTTMGFTADALDDETSGKIDVFVINPDKTTLAVEFVMTVRGPQEHEEHRKRFDAKPNYKEATHKGLVTIGHAKSAQVVKDRVMDTRADGVDIIGLVPTVGHTGYTVYVRTKDSPNNSEPFKTYINCDCIARGYKKSGAAGFEIIVAQQFQSMDPPATSSAHESVTTLDTPAKFLQRLLDKVVKKHDAEDGAHILRQLGYKVVADDVEKYFACVRDGFKEEAAVPTAGPPAGFAVRLAKEGLEAKALKFTGPGTTGPDFCAMTGARLEKLFGAENPVVDAVLKFRRDGE